jgi:FkbM family methyltransferase
VSLHHEILRAHRRLGTPIPNPVSLVGYDILFMGDVQFQHLFKEIFLEASYFFKADTETPVIIDCGSNIGMSVLFFKLLYPKARIIAFEPDPLTFETLRRNVNNNHLSNVELHQVALSDKDGSLELFRNDAPDISSLRMSMLRERQVGQSVIVPARRLSDYILCDVDLVKIDVEGAEEVVIGDLVSANKLRYIKRLHIEYHHHIERAEDKFSSILRLLEVSGFGYQLRAHVDKWPDEASFQDVSLYCYRKH